MYEMTPEIQKNLPSSLALVCAAVTCLSTLTTAVFAADDTEDIYIDSVYSWGIWELGLEPASGAQVSANKVMNDRSRHLQFRPNDNAAYTPRSIPVQTVQPPLPPPTSLPPPVPIVGVSGSGPIVDGMVPNPPNLR